MTTEKKWIKLCSNNFNFDLVVLVKIMDVNVPSQGQTRVVMMINF